MNGGAGTRRSAPSRARVSLERVCANLDGPMGEVIREAGRADKSRGFARQIEINPDWDFR